MAEKEQVKPLAPASYQIHSDFLEDHQELDSIKHLKLQQRRYIKCCGLITALFLILSVTFLILALTVFHVKNPKIKLNSVSVLTRGQANDQALNLTANLTIIASVSVKNPNVASFKYCNSTTQIYYGGSVIGEGKVPAGVAKARRTVTRNLTVDIVTEKILKAESFGRDVSIHGLNISSYSRIEGKVKIMGVVKKNVVVKLNCSMVFNISLMEIQGQDCKQHVKI